LPAARKTNGAAALFAGGKERIQLSEELPSKYFEWTSLGNGLILESLEAANANFNAQWAHPRRARQDPSRMAELEQRNKASYDQIVGSYQ
jgi:hypothetical protein